MKVRAVIDAVNFAELCAGKQIILQGICKSRVPGFMNSEAEVELILSDIGFDAMQSAVDRAKHRAEWEKKNTVG